MGLSVSSEKRISRINKWARAEMEELRFQWPVLRRKRQIEALDRAHAVRAERRERVRKALEWK